MKTKLQAVDDLQSNNHYEKTKKVAITDIQPEFWTTKEFSKVINVSPATLKGLLGSGEVPGAYRIGKLWRIHKETFYSSIKESKKYNNSIRERSKVIKGDINYVK